MRRVLILTLFVLALLPQQTVADESGDVDGTVLTQDVNSEQVKVVDQTTVERVETEVDVRVEEAQTPKALNPDGKSLSCLLAGTATTKFSLEKSV